MDLTRFGRRLAIPTLLPGLLLLAACTGAEDESVLQPTDTGPLSAEIRRTSLGIPHIKSSNWQGLGYGFGYAQAEDTLCTFADAVLTYRGERSSVFGGNIPVAYNSTIERPLNIDSDFFHRQVITDEVVANLQSNQPADVQQLANGFVAGYNRYIAELPAGTDNANAACRNEPWVSAITTADVYRRLYSLMLAGGYSLFVGSIANSTRPTQSGAHGHGSQPDNPVAPALRFDRKRGVGSNAVGFGTGATGTDTPLLLGNPHWYWSGPDRFYQAHLSIPDVVDVAGASMIGVPLILLGHNNDVAWSHTFSDAARFGLFELSLVEGDPTQYLLDGQPVAMTSHEFTVQNLLPTGELEPVTRTFYQSRHGLVVDLSDESPILAWTDTKAFAIRDINADNTRVYRNWMRWSTAQSLDELIQIQREEAAMPWVNTVAVGRGGNQAWYADIGAVPNVTQQLLDDCPTATGTALGLQMIDGVPLLDGSRSECNWQDDADSLQPGALGTSRMPSLLRNDYVANMNDSYWLTNPDEPLDGFPVIMGPAGSEEVSLRTRMGHQLIRERLAGTDEYGGMLVTPENLQQMTLNSRSYSAEQYKNEVLSMVCTSDSIDVGVTAIDVSAACAALRAWDNRGNAESRGAHVWDVFWETASEELGDDLWQSPFDPADPLNTPTGLNAAESDSIMQIFAHSVQTIQQAGIPEEAARADYQFASRGDRRYPLAGGCGFSGYFTVVCADNVEDVTEEAEVQSDTDAGTEFDGNSYLQIVSFPGDEPVESWTMLAPSLSDDEASPHYSDGTRNYSDKLWLRLPFSDAQIQADPEYSTHTISSE